MNSLRGIDTHAHVFSADRPSIQGARYRPSYAATLDAWRDRWPAGGITHGVLVQPSFFGTDNTEMLDALSRDPTRLRGVAVVHATATARDLAWLHFAGVRGIRLNLQGAGDAPHDPEAWRHVFEHVSALGWHVEVFAEAGRLADVAPLFHDTTVPLVFDQFGNPGTAEVERTFEAVAALAKKRDVWCKLSAPYRLGGADPKALAARWLEAVGPTRLLWGSDWPHTRHEQEGDYARLRANLDEWIGSNLAPAVLWDNAARLYRFA